MESLKAGRGSKSQLAEFWPAVEVIKVNADKVELTSKLFSGLQHFREMPRPLDLSRLQWVIEWLPSPDPEWLPFPVAVIEDDFLICHSVRVYLDKFRSPTENKELVVD
jgi:hypothetical protein